MRVQAQKFQRDAGGDGVPTLVEYDDGSGGGRANKGYWKKTAKDDDVGDAKAKKSAAGADVPAESGKNKKGKKDKGPPPPKRPARAALID